jgi:hypothetical protein
MSLESHKGEILPIANRGIPLSSSTKLHASYDYDFSGFNSDGIVYPTVKTIGVRLNNNFIAMPYGNGVSTSKITIEMWVKAESIDQNYVAFATDSIANKLLSVEMLSGRWAISIGDSGVTSGNQPPNTGIANAIPKRWQHLCLVMNGTTASLYVDGESVYNKAYVPYVLGGNFTIGKGSGSSTMITATVSDFRIWNVDRTQAQIKENMFQLGASRTGLLAHYPMREAYGRILTSTTGITDDVLLNVENTWENIITKLSSVQTKFGNPVLTRPSSYALSYPAKILNTDAGTVSFWFKHHRPSTEWENPSMHYFVVNENYNSAVDGARNAFIVRRITADPNKISVSIVDPTGAEWNMTSDIVADQEWHMLTLSWDKTLNRVSFYYDGELVKRETPTFWFTNLTLAPCFSIGSYHLISNETTAYAYFDELRIDNREVGSDEVTSWFQSNSSFTPFESSLAIY